MGIIVKPSTFTAGTTAVSAQVNSDFDTLYNEFNGNIDNSNIKASAAIEDTKLAQITSGGKVSTAALTGTVAVANGGLGLSAASAPAASLYYVSSIGTFSNLASGTNSQFLMTTGGALAWTSVTIPTRNYMKLSDTKTANTAGGDFTSGAFQTRTINTIDSNPDSICTTGTNTIILPAGTYECSISCPAYSVDNHVAKLRNTTDNSDTLIGTAENSNATTGRDVTRSFIVGRFTIADQKTFEIQHRCTTTASTNGFGLAANLGVSEVYTIAQFWKIG